MFGCGGSSPLARGTPGGGNPPAAQLRLIPARAGNTPSCSASSYLIAAHPRSRGEHVSTVCRIFSSTGSSPLARGTLSMRRRKPSLRRLIPARAGNTARAPCLLTTAQAHPRSRGEHRGVQAFLSTLYGSSPLARGTRNLLRHLRSIRLAHPRSRGEHKVSGNRNLSRCGSSPLARGTPASW